MKDIKLKHTPVSGEYDWDFGWNDLEVVRGINQLINAVRHAVLLHEGELIQEMYQGKGCNAYEYNYIGNTTQKQMNVCSQIENAAKSVDGVYDAKATVLSDVDDMESQIQLELLTSDMEEVVMDVL